MAMSSSLFVKVENAKLIQKEYLTIYEGTDWNCYKSNEEEHLYLKRNIGYALFGPPIVKNVLGYSKQQAKNICEIYRAICKNHYLINTGELYIRIIYICICSEVNEGSNGKVPVFVLKKCVESSNPCTIFIDNYSRVYRSWTAYLTKNKLPECFMVCPKNGKYTGIICLNEEGEEQVDVLLEYHGSPAGGFSRKVLKYVDVAGTLVSVASVAAIGAATVFTLSPVVSVVAAVGGVGTGIIGAGRSIYSLVDRTTHQQTVSVKNAEARSHWISTGTAVISTVAYGATTVLARTTRCGAVIGKGTQMAFNTLSAANLLGSNGISIFNFCGKWTSEEKITFMDVFQLSSSILFFQMSLMNFRTASAIIQETQTSVISEYQDTLRSNRHRKVFTKALLEARRVNGEIAGNAEIIKGIKRIKNPNEYFAGLVKMNKDLNANGDRYTSNAEGQAVINNVTIIDPVEFNNMTIKSRKIILNNIPRRPIGSNIKFKIADITAFFNSKSSILPAIANIRDCSDTIAFLLKDFSRWTVKFILNITISFLDQIIEELESIKKIHPLVNVIVIGVQYIMEYFKRYAESLNLKIMETIDIIFEDPDNYIKDFIESFKEWWNNQKEIFYSIPNEYIDINNRRKVNKKCKTCQGIYFAPLKFVFNNKLL